MGSNFNKKPILNCNYCGNKTPHSLNFEYEELMYFDEISNDQKFYEPYTWLAYACATCGGLNIFGEFFSIYECHNDLEKTRIYPKGADILPPAYTMTPSQPIPDEIYLLYQEVWPLRHKAPSAFIGQIRRILEYICKDKNADGKNLYLKLKNLSEKGIFPGYFSEISDLLRTVGNMGAHATSRELSVADAELIDDFFKSIVNYVYIAPARIERMKERLRV